jgi:hypothetical protein
MPGRRPVAVAVEEGPDDAAVQGAFVSDMMRQGSPVADHLVDPPIEGGNDSALDVKPLFIGRSAAIANAPRSVDVLQSPIFRHSATSIDRSFSPGGSDPSSAIEEESVDIHPHFARRNDS